MKFDQTVDLVLRSSFFVESPMYYDGNFNSEMQDIDHNRIVTKQIIEKHKPFDSFKEWDVYKIQDAFDEDVFTFCLVKNETIDAFMEIASKKENNFSRGVWQKKTNKGLIRDFIFNFLPKYYNSLISDKTSNKLGIEFYKKLLKDAIQKQLKVTVLKGSLKNEVPYESDDFDNYWVNVNTDVPTHPTFVTFKDVLFKIYF